MTIRLAGPPASRFLDRLKDAPPRMFEFSSYHISLAVLGCGIIIAYWLPRFVSGREPAASTLLIAAGACASLLLPGLGDAIDPTIHAPYWEHLSEFALIIGLFGTGLRIDRLASLDRWMPTIRLLACGSASNAGPSD